MPITVKRLRRNKGKSKCSHLHCRLCAVLKPCAGLLDLRANEDGRKSILDQLSRLSICVSNLECEDDLLPKTICSACMSSLDKAFNFALKVQKAQEELNTHILVCYTKEHDYSKSLKQSSNFPDIVVHDNINKKVEKSENNPRMSQPFQTTEECNISELQNHTKLPSDTSIEIDSHINDFKEEFKISVTDYQITGHSQSKPNEYIDSSNYDVIDLIKVDAKVEATPGICFDFEEENIDEHLEVEDNNYEILRRETNLACNANELKNREITLMDLVDETGEEINDDENNDTILIERIDLNVSESYKENLVENEKKIESDINIQETEVNSCKSYEMHKQKESSSEDEAENEEFDCVKQSIIKNYTKGIPFVMLNKISDAYLVALSSKFCIKSLKNVSDRSTHIIVEGHSK